MAASSADFQAEPMTKRARVGDDSPSMEREDVADGDQASETVRAVKEGDMELEECVNVKAIRWAQSLLPMRNMKIGKKSYAQALQVLLDQGGLEGSRDQEIGTFKTQLRRIGSSESVGMRGRRFALQTGAISAFS